VSKKKWRETEAILFKLAGEAAEGVEQLRGKSGTRGRPLDEVNHTQTQAVFSRFVQDDEQTRVHSNTFDRIIGSESLKESPPDDMPAIEKIKLYARSGYHLHHIGTDEDFERVWGEAFYYQ
jgi:hypothetical protein